MLPETPLLMVFEKKTYRKVRRKVPIKTLPKTSPFFFKKRPYRKSPQQVRCKRTIQNTGKSPLSWRDCIEKIIKNFLNWKTTENAEKPRFRKKDSIKNLVKKHVVHRSCLQHRWNSAIRKQERFKRLIKQSLNKEPTKNAVEVFFR